MYFNLQKIVKLSCPAKVNLFLAIKARDDSGYHEIETIMFRTGQLEDFIYLEPAQKLIFECDTLPSKGNTILRAIEVLEEESGRKFTYKVRLEKNIPPMSGLGGGSSNAAAIMLYLNEHEGLDITHKRLMELGAKVGMDVPFFISGNQLALCTHYGEKVQSLPDLPKNLHIEIHHSGKEISTKEAYAAWDAWIANLSQVKEEKEEQTEGKQTELVQAKANLSVMLAAIKAADAEGIISALHNDFQLIYPFFRSLSLNDFVDSNAYGGLILSGSGGSFCVVDVRDN